MRKDSKDYYSIDPFNESAIILQPSLYLVVNNIPTQIETFQLIKGKSNFTNFNIVELAGLNFTLNLNYDDDTPNIDYMIGFSACDQNFLVGDQKCASKEIVS